MEDTDFFDFIGDDEDQQEEQPLELEKKKYKMDMMELLSAIDNRKFNFLSTKTPDEVKGFAPIVALRFAASLDDKNKHNRSNLIIINEFVNKRFWDLYKHPELQYKLMAMCGSGKKSYHPWLAAKTDKLDEHLIHWMRDHHVLVSDEELHIKISKMSIDDICTYIDKYAVTKQDREELLISYGKLTGQSAAIATKLEAEKTSSRRRTKKKG